MKNRKNLLIGCGGLLGLGVIGCCALGLLGGLFEMAAPAPGSPGPIRRLDVVTNTPPPAETFTAEPALRQVEPKAPYGQDTATPVPATTQPAAPPPVAAPPPGPASACPQGCETPAPGCEIKGNISREGEKIYHVPGGRDYDKTEIDPGKGERWFCTPGEAAANGWRASQQ